jgi:hypothetical protein
MEEMDEVAVLVEKIMPIKQSQGVTFFVSQFLHPGRWR